jgi:hypothetical protein
MHDSANAKYLITFHTLTPLVTTATVLDVSARNLLKFQKHIIEIMRVICRLLLSVMYTLNKYIVPCTMNTHNIII